MLPECVVSLLAQDYPDFELILVNDGSTDGSGDLCHGYAAADRRVKAFDKPNGGPASARNFGLEHCAPEASKVCFVDSDDYVEPDYLSRLAAVGGDLVVAGALHHYEGGATEPLVLTPGEFTSFRDNAAFLASIAGGAFNPPWGKLYDLGIIRSNGLRFPDVRVLEDVSFNFAYLEHCRSVSMIDYAGYHYVHRPGSETSRADMATVDNYCRFHFRLRDFFAPQLVDEVDRFIYPQYMALILRFIRRGDHRSARQVMARQLVRRSFSAHRSGSVGEAIVKNLIRIRATLLAKWLI